MRLILPLLCLILTGCAIGPAAPPPAGPKTGPAPDTARPIDAFLDAQLSPREAARNFETVLARVEPVIEDSCRRNAPQLECDFLIVVDDALNVPPNAFQTVDEAGRPVIVFTLALIAQVRNQDELAFVLSHEAAHHIAGHLTRQRAAASVGASILGNLVGASGDERTIRAAQQIGAALGARTYSKTFELEADALGTRITLAAGYDALRGAAFFSRIPDPGDRFLGTHPANADRIDVVRREVERAALAR